MKKDLDPPSPRKPDEVCVTLKLSKVNQRKLKAFENKSCMRPSTRQDDFGSDIKSTISPSSSKNLNVLDHFKKRTKKNEEVNKN